ncbi:TetR/AcrR family transcriptional regulator [Streptomyces sp. N2-109]|uniref:TetR/AcrR family transcriptional regulator n=1 Tax=Streptomyces gossypii TaxID=2883101 RepID=A0ABT2JXI2_9ACTN|nr:TetR/AcrR family transcriptional regulator [Streptomyces gossypii]MCT2592581.1 TetR/AcrR family transcriptional regulator [Streptomyces gossypii]
MTDTGTPVPAEAARTDRRVERGNQTRQLILRRTVDIASVEGLAGLSLGRLAGELKLSKSGVFALFGSKEELQLATVRAAKRVYVQHVVQPAQEEPPGIGRVLTLAESWIRYSEERVFPGGCFFHSVSAEFDARQGPVRDAIATARREWIAYIEQTIEEAREAGEVGPDTEVAQLAFEILAFLETANADSVLHDDPASYGRARAAIRSRLTGCATDASLLPQP